MRRLIVHALVLGVFLAISVPIMGPGVPYSSDEGAAILQAKQIEDGGWLYEPTLTAIDPEDEARPFLRGVVGERGLAPYARHPAYPVLLVGASRAVGPIGYVVLSALGTWVAAVCAALLARRLSPRLPLATLWTVGVFSPLFVAGQLVLAHAPAAAMVAVASVATLEHLRSRRRTSPWLALMFLASAAAALMRSEALLLAPALVVATLLWGYRSGLRPRIAVPVVTLGLAAITAVGVEQWATNLIVGDPLGVRVPGIGENWAYGRLQGLVATWFDPSYTAGQRADGLLTLAVLAVSGAALIVRGFRAWVPWVPALLGVAMMGYLYRLIIAPSDTVPGLVIAFPLVAVGLVLLRRQDLMSPAQGFVGAAAGVLVVAVVLTQYSRGGGFEWGGRYFGIALPLLTPVLLQPVLRAWDTTVASRRVRRTTGLFAAVILVSIVLIATVDIRRRHALARDLSADLAEAATQVDPLDATGRPLVVSPGGRLLPQILWNDFGSYDWLVFSQRDVERYVPRIDELGVDRILMYSAAPDGFVERFEGWEEIGRSDEEGAAIVTLERVQEG